MTTSQGLAARVLSGEYQGVLETDYTQAQVQEFTARLSNSHRPEFASAYPPSSPSSSSSAPSSSPSDTLAIALAAFSFFLQINVTGPAPADVTQVEALFQISAAHSGGSLSLLRKRCFTSLEADGVSPYPYVLNIELFCFARDVLSRIKHAPSLATLSLDGGSNGSFFPCLPWLLLRVHTWHYKLLAQPHLGAGSVFNKSSQWSDVPSLQELIEKSLEAAANAVLESPVDGEGEPPDSTREKVLFLLEAANTRILLGHDSKAKDALRRATELNKFTYALSGAMGKRTRFQEKSTSQLVVLAKSNEEGSPEAISKDQIAQKPETLPEALPLNDDTLLEKIEFGENPAGDQNGLSNNVPLELAVFSPDAQPQLSPLDQIILLTEATLKDAFSPVDGLTSEEILPFAVRVVADKSTNWQIYTQALLTRSRIEVHRSRTVERGVLQMQAVVDQIVIDATTPSEDSDRSAQKETDASAVPSIRIDSPKSQGGVEKATSFLPATKAVDSAPAYIRLEYVHALSSAPRWHLESELAYAWVGVGSLASALEIFKRLRLWAEVALCLATSELRDDEGGRGSGGEEKARAVLRWQLFRRVKPVHDDTADADAGAEDDGDDNNGPVDVSALKAADHTGPERDPPPPNAPRLFCILGDIENEPAHYERAWKLSKNRFSRAQKSLGEYYLRQKEWERAREAYRLAVDVNRLNPELWNRLGDISLRLGRFADAAEAFGRAIASANEVIGGGDARTWSNLGSSLYSLYLERMKELKKERESGAAEVAEDAEGVEGGKSHYENDEESDERSHGASGNDPSALLSQSLAAFKRGASIANDNWRIWDNVLTLSARMRPPVVSDSIFALRHIIRIRKSEDALDIDILRLLLNEAVLSKPKPELDSKSGSDEQPTSTSSNGTREASPSGVELPRGSTERAVCDLFETAIVPLITKRSELWELIARERVWRHDYAGAIDVSERAWRATVGQGGGGLLPSSASVGGEDGKGNWLEDQEAWEVVVERTDDLVSVLENYGAEAPAVGIRWRSKARSALRSVMGKAKDNWEGSEGWDRLQNLLDGL